MTTKRKVKYGTLELDPDEFSPLYARAHISIKIPMDTLTRFRAEAERRGTKYQTLMNEVLQDAAMGFRAQDATDPVMDTIRWLEQGAKLARALKRGVR